MYEINETHDPNLKSWVESANDPNTDFPLQNLPFCIFSSSHNSDQPRVGVAIGDKILDIWACYGNGLFSGATRHSAVVSGSRSLNELAKDDLNSYEDFRRHLFKLLEASAPSEQRSVAANHLYNSVECEFISAFTIGDYTDFYCSIYHATNVGSMFRPDNPLLPNFKYIPIGYHGRASSIVISGSDIKRPHGQNRSDAENPPVFIPSKSLDYEMELGFFVGRGNKLGTPVSISDAEKHIFGVCLVNDWSARDVQAWEYQPLGPFLAKNFATTISPFVVTMEALAPFRSAAFERPPDDPQPLDYLRDSRNEQFGGIDINLEVYIQTEKMRAAEIQPHQLSRSNTKDLYWTIGQMLTHHASNGCNLQAGDLMATGTVSGKEKSERGCLLELTWRGTEPITLASGETRRFLEDGDEIIMRGYCEREGFRRIGLGECRGKIVPAGNDE